jgi:competence protein ComEC
VDLTKSKIFLFFCLSFILGVALSSFVFISPFLIGIFLILAVVFVILFWQRNWKWVVFGFCLIFAVVGIWRFQARAEKSDNDVSRFNGKKVILTGIADGQPDRRMENQKIVVRAKRVNFGANGSLKESRSLDAVGKILITAPKYPEYQYGDELKIKGKLQEPKIYEDFDYKAYLAKDDIYSVMYSPEIEIVSNKKGNKIQSVLFKIKNKFEEELFLIFPEPQASLADGLILGVKSTLPQKLLDIFAAVGITHIIALSGFNITIIAEALRRISDYLMVNRYYSFWLTVGLIIGFILMTGASASIVRAGIMGILIILARRVGRLYNIRNALVLAAVIMLYFNPKILRFDLGFQLSFLATLGLVYISPFLEKYFLWLPERFGLRAIAIATLSAQAAVLPLLLFSFGKLSLISPFANLLILPFIPLAMLLIFISAVSGFFWIKLGIFIGWLVWIILSYIIKTAEFLALIPGATINFRINRAWMVVLYVLLWGVAIVKLRDKKSTPALLL